MTMNAAIETISADYHATLLRVAADEAVPESEVRAALLGHTLTEWQTDLEAARRLLACKKLQAEAAALQPALEVARKKAGAAAKAHTEHHRAAVKAEQELERAANIARRGCEVIRQKIEALHQQAQALLDQ